MNHNKVNLSPSKRTKEFCLKFCQIDNIFAIFNSVAEILIKPPMIFHMILDQTLLTNDLVQCEIISRIRGLQVKADLNFQSFSILNSFFSYSRFSTQNVSIVIW